MTQEFDHTNGSDVYVCSYEYDTQNKLFRSIAMSRNGRPSQASYDSDSSDSSSDSRDTTFVPSAKKRTRPKATAQTKAPSPLNKRSTSTVFKFKGREGPATPPPPSTTPPLVVAKRSLSLASVPEVLPCRDAEKLAVTRFFRQAVEDGVSPGVLYVCGVPGTGKTAVIEGVLRQHRQQQEQWKKPAPRVVSLNALSLPSPHHVYSELWRELTTQRLGPARALAALEEMFSPGRKAKTTTCVVVVVDEIDVLLTRDQGVLYNLFEWPVRPGSRLAVIGVSNTHDLDERLLPRIASRLSSSKIAFHPYKVDQLRAIIEQRLQLSGSRALFSDNALTCVTRKVAATSGDVRRALELLRRAADEIKGDSQKTVEIQHVTKAMNDIYQSPHMQFMRICSRLEKMVLAALVMEIRSTKKPNAHIQDVYRRLVSHVFILCPLMPGVFQRETTAVSSGTVCRVVHGMVSSHLLACDHHWKGIVANIALLVHEDDVMTIIKEDRTLVGLHSYTTG